MQQILNMILRRFVNKGINSGISAVSNRGRKPETDADGHRQQTNPGPKSSGGLRQAIRMLRRMMRF